MPTEKELLEEIERLTKELARANNSYSDLNADFQKLRWERDELQRKLNECLAKAQVAMKDDCA